MKPFRQAMIVVAIAGLCGLGLGLATAPKEKPRPVSPGGDGHAAGIVQSGATRESDSAPAFSTTSPQATLASMSGVVAGGSQKEVLDALQVVFSDPSLPPLPAGLYRDALLARLVKLGGAQALLDSNQYPASERPVILAAIVRSLAESDLPAAEALMEKLPASEKTIAASEIMGALGRIDPKRGLARLGSDPQMKPFAGALFAAWAKEDPRAAVEAAYAMDPREHDINQRSALSAWVTQDPAAAWKWVDAQPPDRQRRAQRIYFESMVQTDPSQALELMATHPAFTDAFQAQWIGLEIASNVKEADAAVNRLPPGQGRNQLIDGLARALSGEPEETIAWAKTLLPGERDLAMKNLFDGLGWQDPARALDLASTRLEGAQRQQAIGSIISGWAKKDFDAAFDTMLTKLDPESLRAALGQVFMYHTPRDAAAFTRELTAVGKLQPDVRRDALRAMGESWAGHSGQGGSLDQLASLGPDEQAAFADGAFGRSLDPTSTDVQKLRAMLPPEKQARYALEISRPIATTDPAGAAGFLAGLPAEGGKPEDRRLAMDIVMRNWAYLEPDKAVAFVGGLPSGAAKDLASQSLIGQLRNFDLEQATRIAAAVAAPDARGQVIEQLAGDWARVDPARGREAMAPLLATKEDRAHAAALFEQK